VRRRFEPDVTLAVSIAFSVTVSVAHSVTNAQSVRWDHHHDHVGRSLTEDADGFRGIAGDVREQRQPPA